MTNDRALEAIQSELWDVIIVGGGAAVRADDGVIEHARVGEARAKNGLPHDTPTSADTLPRRIREEHRHDHQC